MDPKSCPVNWDKAYVFETPDHSAHPTCRKKDGSIGFRIILPDLLPKVHCMTAFHSILKKRLTGHNLSMVARELAIPKSLLADWVRARRAPSLKNLGHVEKLAGYLGLSLSELLLGRSDSSRRTIAAVDFEDEGSKYKIIIMKA